MHSRIVLPISGVESVIGSMSPTIVLKIVIASRIVTPEKWLTRKTLFSNILYRESPSHG